MENQIIWVEFAFQSIFQTFNIFYKYNMYHKLCSLTNDRANESITLAYKINPCGFI